MDMSDVVAEFPPLECRAALHTRVGQSQFGERPKLVGGLNDADAIHSPVALDFNNIGSDSRTREPDRSAQPSNAAADDQHPVDSRHVCRSLGYPLQNL